MNAQKQIYDFINSLKTKMTVEKIKTKREQDTIVDMDTKIKDSLEYTGLSIDNVSFYKLTPHKPQDGNVDLTKDSVVLVLYRQFKPITNTDIITPLVRTKGMVIGADSMLSISVYSQRLGVPRTARLFVKSNTWIHFTLEHVFELDKLQYAIMNTAIEIDKLYADLEHFEIHSKKYKQFMKLEGTVANV